MSDDHALRLLTFNCWDLKYVAKVRDQRIDAIAAHLARSNYDVIALQEIWVFADYEKIKVAVQHRLPHAKFFYSGALGAGLAILSRFPFISTTLHPYSLNGMPIDVAGGDWFVGKAAASVVILHPLLGQVQVFNTHLFAKGGEAGPEHQRAHRLVNAWEFAKLARQAAELGRYVVALGDFNSIPSTLPMVIIRDHAALHDAWVVTHPDTESSTPLNPSDAVFKHGFTADSPLNTWSAQKSYVGDSFGKRLDYIFYRQPLKQRYPLLRPSECNIVLTDKAPGCAFSYSDHFGLEATFEIHPAPQNAETSSIYRANGEDNVPRELSAASITTTIHALAACYRFSRERSRRELVVFLLCLVLLIAIAIGTAWLHHAWMATVFVVLAAVLTWTGTTMLYEGFLYGNWERNALMNIVEELEIYQKGLEIQAGTQSG